MKNAEILKIVQIRTVIEKALKFNAFNISININVKIISNKYNKNKFKLTVIIVKKNNKDFVLILINVRNNVYQSQNIYLMV